MEKRNPEDVEDQEGDDVQNTEPDVYNEVPAESTDPGGGQPDQRTKPPDELREEPSRTVEDASDGDDVDGPVKGERSGSRQGVDGNQ